MNIRDTLEKVLSGERLTLEEGTSLLVHSDLLPLGQAANLVRQKLHPQKRVTFVIGRNINYTNICTCGCKFCAFYRSPKARDAYIITQEELFDKIDETLQVGGTELLIQGGLHPDLGIEYYENLLHSIKERYRIHIHSFSPPEVIHISKVSNITPREVLLRLKAAGLDSLPGGGAEILVDRVRKVISPNKVSWSLWMKVMEMAHQMGMQTTATMMFGHVETPEERVLHMLRVREQQDRTGGFTAFIPWTFQPQNTVLGGNTATAVDYLKTLAVARLVIDNVPNIQTSWVTQGAKIAQIALSFGANDFGSTMLEENVVRAAGVTNRVPLKEMLRCITEAGFQPAQRSTDYNIIRTF